MSRRTVVRNSFARETVTAERVSVSMVTAAPSCAWCGGIRERVSRVRRTVEGLWLYRFWLEPDSYGNRDSQIGGSTRLFCSRGCVEAYIGHDLDEAKS